MHLVALVVWTLVKRFRANRISEDFKKSEVELGKVEQKEPKESSGSPTIANSTPNSNAEPPPQFQQPQPWMLQAIGYNPWRETTN